VKTLSLYHLEREPYDIDLVRSEPTMGEVIELASDWWEYKGIWPCVSRVNLAQHVEGLRIAVDGGVPG
jgi:hypothetical protein